MIADTTYQIELGNLKPGKHFYSFEIDNDFWTLNKSSDIQGASLHLEIEMQAHSSFFQLRFHFQGQTDVLCDRCNKELSIPMDFSRNLIIKIAEQAEEINEEMISIEQHAPAIDLSHLIFEYVTLELPLKKVHPESLCDQTIIDILNKHGKFQIHDSRWEKLNMLNDKF